MHLNLFLEIIISICTVFGIVFAIFNYFRNPQVNSDKNDALMGQTIQQLRLDLTNLRDNHVHTLDTKLDQTISQVSQLSIEVTKLGVIIQERLPINKNLL